MIILFKNQKIIGIDNNLLNLLNTNLDNLSTKISELELILSSLKKENFTLENHSFKVEEIPIVSLENIKAYYLRQTEEIFEFQENPILNENLIKPEPINESINFEYPTKNKEEILNLEETEKLHLEPSIEQTLQEHILEEIPPKTQETIDNINITPEELPLEYSLEETSNQNLEKEFNLLSNQPQKIQKIEPIKEEKEIQISFESSNEIDEILSLDKESTNKLITEELQKASTDLEIDLQTIHKLYLDLLQQLKEEKKSFDEAIKNHDYDKLHETAHKLKGAALNLRLSKLALILKQIDEDAKNKKNIEEIQSLIEKVYNFFNKLENKDNNKIPDNIKRLILITIQNYLETHNEKKFKKDIKYIEKLLNTKIVSLEDLQELIKE